MSLKNSDILIFAESDPAENPWVKGKPEPELLSIEPYNKNWPDLFKKHQTQIKKALGDNAIAIEHIGSTAVEGLAAKPIIDIDLIVLNSANELSYVPALEAIGYELRVREPSWYQHRCLRLLPNKVNLHVFSLNCAEAKRHILFRNWLRSNIADRNLYAQVKLSALSDDLELMMDYNKRKHEVIHAIYQRAFKSAGII
ncbi:GrpB family protein [Pseudomonas sp. F1_0610]|uniref:GrpB family protein n=1 Tax=Pseudomonas sp. F1_0610 TaxID=3114284 RepID=UPI0039C3A79E